MTAPTLAAVRMGGRLTTPFGRGADTLLLHLLPGADPSTAKVVPYDFIDHQTRFDRPPEPSYVLAAARDVGPDTTVVVTYSQPGGPPATVRVTIPAGTLAGTSVALGIPVSAQIRVTGLAMTPEPPDDRPDQSWRLTALLGTTAKLLWVLGGERDQLRGQFARTVAQRHLPTATGRSLDLIGADLGVPRFPPLPYGFDADTVALYHLDDVAGNAGGGNPVAQDVTGQYPGRTGHLGSLHGSVQLGAAGRYGTAFGFGSSDAAVEVATDPAFDIAANGSATMECFVRPDAGSRDGQVLFRHPAPGGAGAGWLLSVGEFGRGVARNPRLVVSDGTAPPVTLFADLSLPTDAFTHLAGVLDRTVKVLRLYVDGVLRASGPLDLLGAVGNTAPLRIGPADSAFRGVIDEVRISAVARTDFSPALGEADEHYRRRLRVFRRWVLPTPANLAATLNELVGTIGGRSAPLVKWAPSAPPRRRRCSTRCSCCVTTARRSTSPPRRPATSAPANSRPIRTWCRSAWPRRWTNWSPWRPPSRAPRVGCGSVPRSIPARPTCEPPDGRHCSGTARSRRDGWPRWPTGPGSTSCACAPTPSPTGRRSTWPTRRATTSPSTSARPRPVRPTWMSGRRWPCRCGRCRLPTRYCAG
ncbi:MAG: hypothetical protein LC808_22640 [Actinobacteria bacterium]|nr:hypothetical protein [Actinomycetota bacterium]